MIKTLRITSVAAVILAVVVLASVLGFLRPAWLIHLGFGMGGDKQIENILGGPSAVDRFKTQYGSKVPSEDTTPPLIKQADLFANIINPQAPPETPAKLPAQLPPKPSLTVKPPVAVSNKFDLLGTCYSSNPKTSLAYIRLPDNTLQWVGLGAEIGHVTIKEIHKGSVICWDGKSDFEVPAQTTPETSSLLETGKTPVAPAPSLPRPTIGGKALGSPVKSSMIPSNRTVVPATPVSSAQISKEEQERLSRLGDQLKNGTGVDSGDRDAAANKLIGDYKSARMVPPGIEKLPKSSDPNFFTGTAPSSENSLRDQSRRQYLQRLSKPRSTKN